MPDVAASITREREQPLHKLDGKDVSCDACTYWVPVDTPATLAHRSCTFGQCRASAPGAAVTVTHMDANRHSIVWAVTADHDWCGQFKAVD